jgi:hypothetical protein
MMSLAEIVARQVAEPAVYPQGRFAGRGIVICAGGPRYFTCAFILVHLLRHALGCTLPIQVWHLGQREMSPAMRRLLADEGVELMDAEPLLARYPAVIRNGWALKPYAVMHSRFEQVLSLDADAFVLRNPGEVFEWPEFLAQGALFWPDALDLGAENPVWAALGLAPRQEISFETGIFAVDKARCWAALALTVALNNASSELYRMIYGEKDSFLLSWLALGQKFTRLGRRPLMFDSDLIQLDPAGEPFVHHRTHAKYLLVGPNRPMFGGRLGDEVAAAHAALRAGWTGAVFHPPAMSAAAAAMTRALAGREWVYQASGASNRVMVLDADHQVGQGRGDHEQHWAVVERDGVLALQLFSLTGVSLELFAQADGGWFGETVAGQFFTGRLIAPEMAASWPYFGKERVVRESAALVEAVLGAAGLGAGFDDVTLTQVAAALTLLNRTHDDVPEVLRGWPADAAWRAALMALADELQAAREARLDAVVREAAPIDTLRTGFYDRAV